MTVDPTVVPPGHELIGRLARQLRAAIERLGDRSPQVAPEIAALALTLDDELVNHLASEEETLFPAFDRGELADAVARLRHEHEVLRLQSVGVRHLAARVAVGGAQAEEAKALFVPIADAFLDTLHTHSVHEDDEIFPLATRVLGPERMASLTRAMAAAERTRHAMLEMAGRAPVPG